MNLLPRVRNRNVIIQELDNELLLYDLQTNKAYNLNNTVKIIFNACDGQTTFDELNNRHQFSDDPINFTLSELNREGLLEDKFASPFDGLNRRQIIRKIGIASLVALPVITSLVTPVAAQSSSVCRGTAAPGTMINCTRGISGCEVDIARSSCASCQATATTPSDFCLNPTFPYLCTCTSGNA